MKIEIAIEKNNTWNTMVAHKEYETQFVIVTASFAMGGHYIRINLVADELRIE